MIKETRHIVKAFNSILQKMVKKYAKGDLAGKLVWLDFYQDLLTPDGGNLKEEYNLDGTHVHPNYLSVLEAAVNKAVTR